MWSKCQRCPLTFAIFLICAIINLEKENIEMSELRLKGFGPINSHIIGRVLKEAVRRATVVIRNERFVFEAHTKESYSGTMDDVFTSADIKAQEIYLRTFQECFPLCGVVAEEESLTIPSRDGCTAYFTVDSLDGTKAYVRRQSHGVGTMVALVQDGVVISAFIGDTNTEEMYGYRPGSTKVHRITRLDTFEVLDPNKAADLKSRYMLLRNPPNYYSKAAQKLLPKFKNYEVMGGSIGVWMARLWKGEVGAVLINKGWETPWNSTPVIGISQKLGYVFLRPSIDGLSWKEYQPTIATNKYYREHDILVIHRNNLNSLFPD